MKTVSRIKTVQMLLQSARKTGTIGFVPTMGAFHDGHLSLIQRARRECIYVAVSLFVNPLQFCDPEDYLTYPKDLPSDQRKAASAGVDLLWVPSVDEIYPPGHCTFIEVGEIGNRWEGAARPGHFKGVATVVAKLFKIVQPHRVYLGRKDYQQVRVIQQMVRDLHFNIALRVLPTVREKDGLAMSSRNVRFADDDRKAAPILYKALCHAKRLVSEGEDDCRRIVRQAQSLIRSESRATIDYITMCNPVTLEPIERLTGKAVLLLAVKIGNVRLIDNVELILPRGKKRRIGGKEGHQIIDVEGNED